MANWKSLIFIALGSTLINSLYSQDTIYFDSEWVEVETKANASYFRLENLDNTGLWVVRDYFLDGNIQMKGTYQTKNKEIEQGNFIYYHHSGIESLNGTYEDGKKTGTWTRTDSTGTLQEAINYSNNEFHGSLKTYWPNGQIRRSDNFSNGELDIGTVWDENGVEVEYYPYFQMPEFVGGEEAMFEWIKKHTKYPRKARRKGYEGFTSLNFVVTTEGQITNVSIVEKSHDLLDQEAIRVVKSMPKWNPGKVEGVPVDFKFNLPFRFELEQPALFYKTN